ncbi:hypothetical protein HK096_007060 [Nowakowskiella sp. JEL0078]|nr:hypothetical protein HK096_007060 [Nowakowskiella sp. JEL0078]
METVDSVNASPSVDTKVNFFSEFSPNIQQLMDFSPHSLIKYLVLLTKYKQHRTENFEFSNEISNDNDDLSVKLTSSVSSRENRIQSMNSLDSLSSSDVTLNADNEEHEENEKQFCRISTILESLLEEANSAVNNVATVDIEDFSDEEDRPLPKIVEVSISDWSEQLEESPKRTPARPFPIEDTLKVPKPVINTNISLRNRLGKSPTGQPKFKSRMRMRSSGENPKSPLRSSQSFFTERDFDDSNESDEEKQLGFHQSPMKAKMEVQVSESELGMDGPTESIRTSEYFEERNFISRHTISSQSFIGQFQQDNQFYQQHYESDASSDDSLKSDTDFYPDISYKTKNVSTSNFKFTSIMNPAQFMPEISVQNNMESLPGSLKKSMTLPKPHGLLDTKKFGNINRSNVVKPNRIRKSARKDLHSNHTTTKQNAEWQQLLGRGHHPSLDYRESRTSSKFRMANDFDVFSEGEEPNGYWSSSFENFRSSSSNSSDSGKKSLSDDEFAISNKYSHKVPKNYHDAVKNETKTNARNHKLKSQRKPVPTQMIRMKQADNNTIFSSSPLSHLPMDVIAVATNYERLTVRDTLILMAEFNIAFVMLFATSFWSLLWVLVAQSMALAQPPSPQSRQQSKKSLAIAQAEEFFENDNKEYQVVNSRKAKMPIRRGSPRPMSQKKAPGNLNVGNRSKRRSSMLAEAAAAIKSQNCPYSSREHDWIESVSAAVSAERQFENQRGIGSSASQKTVDNSPDMPWFERFQRDAEALAWEQEKIERKDRQKRLSQLEKAREAYNWSGRGQF